MKTSSSYIVVGTYSRKNLFDLIYKITKLGVRLGPGKDLIKNMVEWPNNQFPRRSEVFPYPTNDPARCTRVANFFELCAFILRQPSFVCQIGSIEAYDDSLEEFYKETDIDLTVPVFGLYGNHATLYLKSRKKQSEAFKLGAND
jgi:hypothetical protein